MITPGIARMRSRPGLAHISGGDKRSASDHEIDEALWAAYRRYDKSAVTQNLLRRYLTPTKAVRQRRSLHS